MNQELLETEIRLKNGGLGGVPDFDVWDSRLETATEISDLVSLRKLIGTDNPGCPMINMQSFSLCPTGDC